MTGRELRLSIEEMVAGQFRGAPSRRRGDIIKNSGTSLLNLWIDETRLEKYDGEVQH